MLIGVHLCLTVVFLLSLNANRMQGVGRCRQGSLFLPLTVHSSLFTFSIMFPGSFHEKRKKAAMTKSYQWKHPIRNPIMFPSVFPSSGTLNLSISARSPQSCFVLIPNSSFLIHHSSSSPQSSRFAPPAWKQSSTCFHDSLRMFPWS